MRASQSTKNLARAPSTTSSSSSHPRMSAATTTSTETSTFAFRPNQTITVKLRNDNTTPPQTRQYLLPRDRVCYTSLYFRDHLSPSSPSSQKHRDGVIRLNFPDFVIFEIYVEWLNTGTVHTKADLQAQLEHTRPSAEVRNERYRTPEDIARAAYTDYLGCYFLSDWIRDTTFKDTIISLLISTMNLPNNSGHPEQFVKCLKPSLVDLLFMGFQPGDTIRKFLFCAVARFGTKQDLERFMPDEGGEEWPRAFVRGLLGWLYGEVVQSRRADSLGRVMEKDQSSEYPFTSTGSSVLPPVSLPSFVSLTTSSESTCQGGMGESETVRMTTCDEQESGAGVNEVQPRWPEDWEEHCFFHEHTYLTRPCHRNQAPGLRVGRRSLMGVCTVWI
ncbi:uncharacterized protein BDR25DRAFT_314935 [Lindgomyces ingoldianus]|uniref:Uncharacterized protein n=1 Tax=Lindgomyces ingoldianus TaxID=673940 RepID=A0ACB6QVU5_9PLEO|nr:uncharacterized protein BDR25DRAFT_314935 [Lindgomyces ingoldianus]KAF2470210.1 hypothetical protein BDR25DRAFT_314935 [Lindgomyces ingoldianus]